MALRGSYLLLACLFLSLFSSSGAQRPKALVIPVTKDAATLQYVTSVSQRTPLVPLDLVVDLGGRFLWVDCQDGYVSSSYRPAPCRSARCSLAGANGCGDCFSTPGPGCNNNTCGVFPENPVTRTSTGGEVAADVLALRSTDGSTAGALSTVRQFLFSCAPTSLLQGLAGGAKGMAGLGKTRVAPPSQLATAFSFERKFAVCLPSTSNPRWRGVIFFGDGHYVLQPNVDVSQSLVYTPLVTNPVSTAGTSTPGEPSYEYFIGVKSIRVGGKRVSLNASLLSIGSDGVGGTKISTVQPYTVLESSIYRAVVEAFTQAAAGSNITRVAPVAPIGVCFEGRSIPSTRVGPGVPWVQLVLQQESVYWTMFGANTMVEVREGVLCLGFVDGGSSPRTAVVVGGYQLEDNLLEFDLARSRLGFSSSLLFWRTTCSNFNFA